MSNLTLSAQLTSNNAQFNTQFRESSKYVQDLKSKLEANQKQLDNYKSKLSSVASGGSSFNSVLGSLKGGLGALGLAFGGAQVAMGVFNGLLESSQSIGDSWAEATQGWKSGVESFFDALSRGDFSNFINNLNLSIERGRELAKTMDKLGDYMDFYSEKEGRIQKDISRNKAIISDKNSTKEQVLQAKKDIKNLQNELQTATLETAQQARKAGLAKFRASASATVKNITENDFYEYLSIPRDTEKNRKFEAYKAEYSRLSRLSKPQDVVHIQNSPYPYTAAGSIQTDSSRKAQKELDLLVARNKELERFRQLENSISDTERKETKDLFNQANSLEKKYYDTLISNNKAVNKADNLLVGGKSKTTKVKIDYEKGSLKELEKQLQDVTQQISSKNLSTDQIKVLIDKRKELEGLVQNKKEELGLIEIKPKIQEGSISDIIDKIKVVQSELNNTKVGTEGFEELKDRLINLQNQKHEVEVQLKVSEQKDSYSLLTDKINEVRKEIRIEYTDNGASEKYKSLIEQLNELTNKEYQINVKVNQDTLSEIDKQKEGLRLFSEEFEGVGSTISSVSGMFQNFSRVMGEEGNNFLTYVASVSSGIASIVPEIIKLIAMNKAKAISSGVANASILPFPASLGSIASIIATITSVFASLPKFANGGIFSGNGKTFGDMHVARVNPGEMILNNQQQRNLFNLLNTSNQRVSNNGIRGDVNFRIQGQNLVGTLNNTHRGKQRII